MKHLTIAVVAMLIAAGAYAGTIQLGPVQVYDFKASLKNSNVARGTDRKTNALYDYKFSELSVLAGFLAIPDCTDCGVGGGYATLFVYRLGDSDRRLFRVPAMFNLVDVFATRADNSGTVLGTEVEGFLTIDTLGAGFKAGNYTDDTPKPNRYLAGFFNDTAGGSLSQYLDMGNTKFWAAGFGRVSHTKDTWIETPNPDPCLPPIRELVPGCTTLESLCGQIVGAMEYDYICAAPYSVLCATLIECVLDTHNAVAGGSWQIRRNVRMEAIDMYAAEQKIIARLPNYAPFNWNPIAFAP